MGKSADRSPVQQAAYDKWVKGNSRASIVEMAHVICRDLGSITPTLRQLYYQFVAKGLAPNDGGVYDRIGAALAEARLSGDFPLDWINDRTRSPGPTYMALSTSLEEAREATIEAIVEAPKKHLWMNRWFGQPKPVCVWVEKEALASVFEGPCRELGVGLFVCRGYPSISSLNDWIGQTEEQIAHSMGEGCELEGFTILYFGDHDPDGLQIPESAMATMQQLARLEERHLFNTLPVQLERCGITLAQVRELNAPPFPAKVSSARYKGYVDRTGLDTAWELDALPPKYLIRLIRESVKRHFDESAREEHAAKVLAAREDFRAMLMDGSITTEALEVMENA